VRDCRRRRAYRLVPAQGLESPRWLERKGRVEEAEVLMQAIEAEASAAGRLPAPAAAAATPPVGVLALLAPPLLQRLLVGSWMLIPINTLIFGFVIFLPQFFLRQGLTITQSFGYTLVLAGGSLVGCTVGAFASDFIGRRWSIIGASVITIVSGAIYAGFSAASDPAIVLSVGFVLIVHLCADGHSVRRLYAGTLSHRGAAARQRHLQHAGPPRHRVLALRGGPPDADLPAAGRHRPLDRAGARADRGGVGLGGGAPQARPGGHGSGIAAGVTIAIEALSANRVGHG